MSNALTPLEMTPELLSHENGHIQLYEYYARLTEKAIMKVKGSGTNPNQQKARKAAIDDWHAKVIAAFNQGEADAKKANDKYDEDTNHGQGKD